MEKRRPVRPKGRLNATRKPARRVDLLLQFDLIERIDRLAERSQMSRTGAAELLVGVAFERISELGLDPPPPLARPSAQ